jgi:hypothetical protein
VADGTKSPVGAAMKRGTGLSHGESFGESRGRAPEGERVPQKGARAAMNAKYRRQRLSAGTRILPLAPFGAPPPFLLGGLFLAMPQNSGAEKCAPRERECFFLTSPRWGEVASVSERVRGSGRCRKFEVGSPSPASHLRCSAPSPHRGEGNAEAQRENKNARKRKKRRPDVRRSRAIMFALRRADVMGRVHDRGSFAAAVFMNKM